MEKKSIERLEQILFPGIQNDEEINIVDKIEFLINFKYLLEDYDNAMEVLKQDKIKKLSYGKFRK